MTSTFYTEPSEVKIVVLPCNRLPSRSKPIFDEQFLFPTKRTPRRVQIWYIYNILSCFLLIFSRKIQTEEMNTSVFSLNSEKVEMSQNLKKFDGISLFIYQADEIILKESKRSLPTFRDLEKEKKPENQVLRKSFFINFNFLFYIGTRFYQSPKQTKSSSDKNLQFYVPNTI